MAAITVSEARANLYHLIDEAATSHQPVLITGKRNNAVLVSEEDWVSIQETLGDLRGCPKTVISSQRREIFSV